MADSPSFDYRLSCLWYVFGINTGAGKTWASTAWAHRLAEKPPQDIASAPLECSLYKPVESYDRPENGDYAFYRKHPHKKVQLKEPYMGLARPLSPHLVWQAVGNEPELREACFFREGYNPDLNDEELTRTINSDIADLLQKGDVILESAGGGAVEVFPGLTNTLLAVRLRQVLDHPVHFLLVSPGGLGSIHSTLVNLWYLESQGIRVSRLVVSLQNGQNVDDETSNLAEIRRRYNRPLMVHILHHALEGKWQWTDC